MRRSHFLRFDAIWVLVALVMAGQCFHQTTACAQPKVIEFLFNYTFPTNDLKTLVADNISSLSIAAISTKKVTFSETKCTLTYIGGQSVSKLTPFSYAIANDGFSVGLHWVANVSKTFGHDSFNVTAEIKEIRVKYTKSYVADKKQFQITDVNYTLTNDMITIKTITPNDSKKADIDAVVKNELFAGINQQFKSLQNWLNDQVSKQKLAETYTTDKYDYEYNKWPLTIDTSNLLVTVDGNDIVVGYKGDIAGDTKDLCPKGIPKSNPKYKMFISMPFILSFAQAAVDRYPSFKNVVIDAKSIRTDNFQFKLADLEYVLFGFDKPYGQYYMNPVSFTCSVNELVSGFVKYDALNFIVKWSCIGLLWTNSTTSVPILGKCVDIHRRIADCHTYLVLECQFQFY